MGSGLFDSTASAARSAFRKTTKTTAFSYDADIKSKKRAAAIHETLDLRNKSTRECRDNADNPVATPIAVMVDVTGSMGRIAELVIDDLHKVVKAITDRGVVKHPALCFGAIGDAFYDKAPIQMGEFESDDILAEKHLANIYREGGGGGNETESYDLAMWFFANQVSTDHWDKRGEKGFLFIIGDEKPFMVSQANHISSHIGVNIGEDMDLQAVATKLQERWNVFLLRPGGASNYSDPSVIEAWEKVLPAQRIVNVDDWHEIVTLIAGTISVLSGLSVSATIDAMKDADLTVSNTTSNALANLTTSATMVAAGIGTGDSDPVERL